jgi:Toprim-like
VRNAAFKGSLGTKDITSFLNPDRLDAAVFEGAFDFLSALVYFEHDRPSSNVLVLNSVSMIDRAVQELHGQGITKLTTYLDHDAA